MKKMQLTSPIFVAVLSLILTRNAPAQDSQSFWIKAYGTPPAMANMTFGNRVGNTTTGIDNAVSFPSEFREEVPPPPAPGFDAIWGTVRPQQFGAGVRGLLDRQFNSWPGGSSGQIDTFRVNFIQQDNLDQDISFKWIDAVNIALQCDSLVMVYLDPNLGTNVRLNMSSTDTLNLPAAGTNGVSFLRIIKYGGLVTGVEEGQHMFDFRLHQNYPNPFNPQTKIQYSVASRRNVSLKIFDVLGREVATLVDEMQDAGFKSVTWDATGVSSGVYFYRVQAGTFVDVKKMILMK